MAAVADRRHVRIKKMILRPKIQTQRPTRPVPASMVTPSPTTETVIPYDYAATFQLSGIPGNLIQDVINVSVEGIFVAVAIGYGFEEDRGRTIDVPVNTLSTQPGLFVPGDVTLDRIPTTALITGFRVDPDPQVASMVFQIPPDALATRRPQPDDRLSDAKLPTDFSGEIFQQVKTREEISFLFSMVDTGTGRELQDQPTHNIASLGISDGRRPFRVLAQPLLFMPRSTVRLQIEERTEGALGTLFIVLYGYKIVRAACPEPVIRTIHGSPACPVETIGRPSERVIPFDYVTRFQLTGREGNSLTNEVSINVEGGFVATAIGYGLAVEQEDFSIQWQRVSEIQDPALRTRLESLRQQQTIALGDLPLRLLPPSALRFGFRIRPQFLRVALQAGGSLATVPMNLADRIFESLNQLEDVSFRYSILDTGSGRELENRPLNNIAGLGIADGERPFKKFARPFVFLPRSTIRVDVQEHFGRGELFIVFQGYKLLGTVSRSR